VDGFQLESVADFVGIHNHTGLWLLSVAKLIAKVRTFEADFCNKKSPAEPMTGKPLHNLRVLQWLAELHFLFECSPEPVLPMSGFGPLSR
jgi:hypothetical protein